MIRHIVFFSAKDEAHIHQIIEGLSLLSTIPHARRLEVARNRKTDQLGNDIDIVVYGEFDSEVERAGPGCLDSAPLDLSGFLPGYAERGALRFCRCVGRA
ncbi:Dabb family protein [Bradyrhizobium japonicum USDA 135]|nr:Dabb family protein [Bradyrhizobium japonicum USDA 135]